VKGSLLDQRDALRLASGCENAGRVGDKGNAFGQ